MSFRLSETKTPAIRINTKMLNAFILFSRKRNNEIFTGWFYYISLDSCKVWKHLKTLVPTVCNGFN